MLQNPTLYTLPISNLSVLWTNKVGEGLWLTLVVVGTIVIGMSTVSVVVSVWVFSWANVVHLVDVTALWATLDRAVAGGLVISV